MQARILLRLDPTVLRDTYPQRIRTNHISEDAQKEGVRNVRDGRSGLLS